MSETEHKGIKLNAGNYTKTNLHTLGFTTASRTKADTTVLENHLQSLYAGKYLDESLKIGLSDEERNDLNAKIQSLQLENDGIESDINHIDETMSKNDEIISALQDDVHNLKLGRFELVKGMEHIDEEFRMPKFLASVIPLLGLSAYIFFFYISITYRALFLSTTSVAQNIANGIPMNNILPSWREISAAISDNPLIMVSPFIIFGFGAAIHAVSHAFKDKKSLAFYSALAGILLITLAMDILIAVGIHNKFNEANILIGFEATPWSNSPDFYTVIILGFVTYLIWSFLFHHSFQEWEKRNIVGRLIKRVKELNKESEVLRKEKNALSKKRHANESEITSTQNKLTTVYMYVSDLKHNVSTFYSGWVQFLTGAALPQEDAKEIVKKYIEPRFNNGQFSTK